MSRSRSGGHRRVLVALAVFSMVGMYFCNVAQATLIAYEPFNYAAGGAVLGQNGGVGWTGAWTSPRPGGAGNTPAGSNTIMAGSLSAPVGLTTVGNRAQFTGFVGSTGTMDGLNRPFPNIAGADGTTTWVSFLGQRLGEIQDPPLVGTNPYPRGANVSFFDSEGLTDDSGVPDERFGIGNSSNATGNEWSIIPEGNGGLREGSPADPWSTLGWGVLRIDHIGDDEVADNAWLWISPDPLGGEPSTASADVTISAAAPPDPTNARDFSNIDFIRPFVGNQTNVPGNSAYRPLAVMTIDEIRIGTTWDDMRNTAGLPEPTSCVLLIFGGLAMCVRRNKR